MLIGIRRFIQALWLVLPGLLIAGMLLAHRRYGAALGSLTVPIGLLAILQAVALLSLRCSRWRVAGLAGSATLALWSAYTLLAQPFLQNEYDTRQFSQAVYHKIQEQPLPLVLQGLTQDGKAIKFMVSINTEMQPLFTQTVAELQAIHGPAYVMVSKSDFALLPVSVTGTWREQLTGRFDKEDFLLLRTAP